MKHFVRRMAWLVPALLGLVIFDCAFSYTRMLKVETTPAGASVYLNNQPAGTTPLTQKIEFAKATNEIEVRVEKAGYDAETRTLTGTEAKALDRSATWNVEFTLVETRRELPVSIDSPVAGCAVEIDGKAAGTTPLKRTLVFTRTKTDEKWSTVSILAQKPPFYHDLRRTLTGDDAADALSKGTELQIGFPLAEIRREVPIEVKANIDGATVSINGEAIGPAPLKHTLVYQRMDGAAPWSQLTLEIAKEGYEIRAPGADGQPEYTRKISIDEAAGGKFSADYFVPVRFVLTPLRIFDVESDHVAIFKTNVLSEVNPSEPGKPPTQITTAKTENPMVLGRLSSVPDHPEQIAYTVAKREERPTANGPTPEEVVGANIWLISGVAQTQMTEGRQFDIDPFVTADGKWIYFSSDRLRTRSIWRMPANGKGGFTKITGDLQSIDTEPAISPDGTKLAYTSRSPNAMTMTPSYVWIAGADGSLPTQMRDGHTPAWAPDGNRIAFVSPENKIWVMDTDGGHPTQLTQGDSIESCPIWTPSGKHLIFASDKAQNDVKQRNNDIWIMDADGSNQTQLTSNGSFDASPAVSSDGRYLYFFSNRGAQRAGQEALQIFRLELPAEDVPQK